MPLDAHRINLLPVAVAAKRRDRQLLAMVFAGAGVVVLLLFALWFQKGAKVNKVRAETEAQTSRNAQLKREIANLDYIEAKAKTVNDKEVLVKASWQGEVSWYRFLQDIATTMPSQTWLTSFQADSKPAAKPGAPPAKPGAAGSTAVAEVGHFTVAGKGFDHPDAADWLARISQMKGVANAWIQQSSASGTDASGTSRTITFGSSGILTPQAWSPRAKRAVEGNLYEGTNAQ